MPKFKKGEYTNVPNKTELLKIHGAAINIFVALCSYADEEGICFPSYKTLSEVTNYSRRTCIDAVEQLVENGFLVATSKKRKNGSHTSNYYQIMEIEKGKVVKYSSLGGEVDCTPLTNTVNKKPLAKANGTKAESQASLDGYKQSGVQRFGKPEVLANDGPPTRALPPHQTLGEAALPGLTLREVIEIINPREKPTEDRLRNVRARLKDYSREEIKAAAKELSKSDWHRQNGQMSVDNLIRASKFGRWYQASLDAKPELTPAERNAQVLAELRAKR